MVEKAVNIQAKASLQPSSRTRKINSKCPKGYRLLAKNKEDEVSQEHQNRDKNKTKSYNPIFANTNQPQTQASKKDKRHRSCQGGHPVTRINATKVVKKNKDKIKDLNYIKCYIYKQKSYNISKYSKKSKN